MRSSIHPKKNIPTRIPNITELSQTFSMKYKASIHGGPKVQTLVLHPPPKIKLQNVLWAWRRKKRSCTHHHLPRLSNVTSNFWPAFNKEIKREQLERGWTPWAMTRRLHLRDAVPQQNLWVQLVKEKCLNDPLTHKCSHNIIRGNQTKTSNFLWHRVVIPIHSCLCHVLGTRPQTFL